MMKTTILLFSMMFFGFGVKTASICAGQKPFSTEVTIVNEGFSINGSLLNPCENKQVPVVLFINGSGPNDRNCNMPGMQTNSFKYLAEALAEQHIATLRYDKRGIAKSASPNFSNATVRFDHYVSDAVAWINYLKEQKKFSKIYVAGLSEGSLIGMLAAQQTAIDGYISLNGPGKTADALILEQVTNQGNPLAIINEVSSILQKLKNDEPVEQVAPYLMSLFHPDLHGYLKNWFSYNPAIEIQKLTIPVLILQGENDIQVSVHDGELLKEKNANAKLVFIENMNHILKNAPKDIPGNVATYNQPDLPLNEKLVTEMVSFIKK